jgi:RimJ/RimL family protein N-acetyltransferase
MGMCNIWLEGSNAKNRDGRMGTPVSPEYWNKGYDIEALKFVIDYAFRWLALHRVFSKGAIISYEKL